MARPSRRLTRRDWQTVRTATMLEEIRAIDPDAAAEIDQWMTTLLYGSDEEKDQVMTTMRDQLAEFRNDQRYH